MRWTFTRKNVLEKTRAMRLKLKKKTVVKSWTYHIWLTIKIGNKSKMDIVFPKNPPAMLELQTQAIQWLQ